MDKLQKRIRETEDEVAEEQLAEHLDRSQQLDRDRALMIIGGFKTANKIQHAIGSELMRGLEVFQSEKIYLSLGFEDFVSFLNSDISPLTKAQYYERKKLLEAEGDHLFDLYGSIGVSVRQRKLLGKGNVELSGETLVVHNGEETTEISINDRPSILDALTALADASADKSIRIQRQQEKIDKIDDKVRDLYAEIDAVKASKVAEAASNPHMIARVELGIAFRRLTDAAERLSPIEKDQFRDAVLEQVAEGRQTLAAAYATGRAAAAAPVNLVGDDFDEALGNYLDTVDDSNDSELAAAL